MSAERNTSHSCALLFSQGVTPVNTFHKNTQHYNTRCDVSSCFK